MTRWLRLAFVVGSAIFLACVVIQVFLAGLGVFRTEADFATHRDFGYAFFLLAAINLVLAILAKAGRVLIGLSALIVGLFILQSVFVAVRETNPEMAALHPLNGFLILLVAVYVTTAARRSLTVTS